MGMKFPESDMLFGEFAETDCFRIEKSDLYQKKLMPKGVKTTEFILFKNGRLYFVEAKKTTPDYAHRTDENKLDCEKYINDILTKFSNTLSIYFSMKVGRLPQNEFPQLIRDLDSKSLRPVLVLVVKNAYERSLDPLKDLLKKSANPILKIWNITDEIVILNEEMAIKKGLVLPQTSAT